MSRIVTFHPALTDIDTTPQTALGGLVEGDNTTHKYVKFNGTTGISVGDVLCYDTTDLTLKTVDKNNTVLGAGVAVAAVGTSSTPQYGFIQTKGIINPFPGTIGGGTAVSVGSVITTDGASDGTATIRTAATSQGVGVIVSLSPTNIVLADFPD